MDDDETPLVTASTTVYRRPGHEARDAALTLTLTLTLALTLTLTLTLSLTLTLTLTQTEEEDAALMENGRLFTALPRNVS